jgi:hypothetical protein
MSQFTCVKTGCVAVLPYAGMSVRGDLFTCGDPFSINMVWLMRVNSISYDPEAHGEPHAVFDTWLQWFDEGKTDRTQTVIFPEPDQYNYFGLPGFFSPPD